MLVLPSTELDDIKLPFKGLFSYRALKKVPYILEGVFSVSLRISILCFEIFHTRETKQSKKKIRNFIKVECANILIVFIIYVNIPYRIGAVR